MAGEEQAAPLRESPEEWLAEVRACEREGELFHAFDLARQGMAQFPDDLRLKHRAILCLASSGATGQSIELLDRLGVEAQAETSLATNLALDIATLRPRLMKDRALATTGSGRTAALAAAARLYVGVYNRAKDAHNPEAYYPGINGATLNLLAGHDTEATRFAREVLDQLAAVPVERRGYYESASALEAHLVLGDIDRAREIAAGLRADIQAQARADYRGLSSTVRQLRLILDAKGLAGEWGDALLPPRVVHYLGHIIAPPGAKGRFPAEEEPAVSNAIAGLLDADDIGFGYGSLAAGADILFAEALLVRGSSLHVILPFDHEEFIEISVRPSGDHWVDRFHSCVERATSLRYATDDRFLQDDHLFAYCSQLAMGLALLRAHHLSSAVEQIAVWDGRAAPGPAGTAADVERWRRTGMPQKIIPVGERFEPAARTSPAAPGRERRTRAMLFGDVHGFSKLTDEQLPPFIETVLGRFAQVIDRNRADILLANTWGDGLFLVFDDAGKAANCALELQEAANAIDLPANGLPEAMGLRIGLHLGPVYAAFDPVLKCENFFGAHVSRAARIEPVTPEGCVFATETMAAVLALHNADAFACEYVGMTEAAKHYGRMRMFLLRRASVAATGP
jgi:class 3 adenylate cyclase